MKFSMPFVCFLLLLVIVAFLVFYLVTGGPMPRGSTIGGAPSLESLTNYVSFTITNALTFVTIFVALIPIVLGVSFFLSRSELEKLSDRIQSELAVSRNELDKFKTESNSHQKRTIEELGSKLETRLESKIASDFGQKITMLAEKKVGVWIGYTAIAREAVLLFAINDLGRNRFPHELGNANAAVLYFHSLLDQIRHPDLAVRLVGLVNLRSGYSKSLSPICAAQVLMYIEFLESIGMFADFGCQNIAEEVKENLNIILKRV